jgi:hypothetical protein
MTCDGRRSFGVVGRPHSVSEGMPRTQAEIANAVAFSKAQSVHCRAWQRGGVAGGGAGAAKRADAPHRPKDRALSPFSALCSRQRSVRKLNGSDVYEPALVCLTAVPAVARSPLDFFTIRVEHLHYIEWWMMWGAPPGQGFACDHTCHIFPRIGVAHQEVDAFRTLINFSLMAHQRQVAFSGNTISEKHSKKKSITPPCDHRGDVLPLVGSAHQAFRGSFSVRSCCSANCNHDDTISTNKAFHGLGVLGQAKHSAQ